MRHREWWSPEVEHFSHYFLGRLPENLVAQQGSSFSRLRSRTDGGGSTEEDAPPQLHRLQGGKLLM